MSAYNVSSSTLGTISSEVSLYFGFRGSSHMISTGCTSSTDAIGYAFNMIRFGLADLSDHRWRRRDDHAGGHARFLYYAGGLYFA